MLVRLLFAAVTALLPAELRAQQWAMRDSVLAASRDRVERGPATAIVVALIDPSGARYFPFGRLSRDPHATPAGSATVFEIASITKTFTATLLADMVVRGEVHYDDSASTFLPDSVRVPSKGGTPITLRHLVTHRSGLARGVRNQPVRDTLVPWTETAARLYDHLSADTLAFQPGTAFLYSNVGAALLGHVLERRAGRPFDELLRERVLAPLGLRDTRFALTPGERRRLAWGYNARGEPRTTYPVLMAAAALHSTAADLARYVQVQLHLTRTPRDSAIHLTQLGQLPESQFPDSYGHGWARATRDGRSMYWHTGANDGYQSFVGYDLGSRRGVVVLSNSQVPIVTLGFRLLDFVPPKLDDQR